MNQWVPVNWFAKQEHWSWMYIPTGLAATVTNLGIWELRLSPPGTTGEGYLVCSSRGDVQPLVRWLQYIGISDLPPQLS